eukprot:TRINITY_DN12131_c0_g1_i1.p1 TRINITY_DN12131_c0_g1~~TRINITY_DN12131_c0_g1_i1.p1  ORF type:complete len:824 (-),score=186.11 TRINITY_DN12131_c0_g1_i1:66-2537(-)
MFVLKRDGRREDVHFDKISERIRKLTLKEPPLTIDPLQVAQKVVLGVYSGVTTKELDILAAETSAYMSTQNPEYGTLAARIAISNLQKETSDKFEEVIDKMYNYVNKKNGKSSPLISDEVYKSMKKNMPKLQAALNYERDFGYDFFGFKTLEKSYLTKINGQTVERPQHMIMRVAVGIHLDDIDKVIQTYDLMSQRWYTHATPTLFNSGTPTPQMSSCFLLTMKDDSIEGIYETLKQCALISKSAGGIGLSVHPIRAAQSYIRGTNGTSNGLVPMLRVFNDTARYVDQGGGKRKGAFAVYLEPWHSDIEDFLELKKNHGKEESRARDLFFGLWVPDLFMKRVEANEQWSLFCPNEAPGLCDVWGEEFEALYTKYETEGRARKSMKAQDLWFQIIQSQIETGTPYMMYKDSCNRKSNQQNLGTIRSSNLCTEIVQYTSPEEVAVCNLASIALPQFVKEETKSFDHQKLYDVVYHVTENLNRIIDRNYYPVPEARTSNMKHRPIGLGVQGLADTFLKLRLPFDSDEAKKLNREIFETIYFAAVSASSDLAQKDGAYSTFEGSPASKGMFQFEMWGVKTTDRWDWETLRKKMVEHGLRNSLLVAPMPTASTSQILGYNECFEPFTSNIYTRRVLAGEFTILNTYLLRDLIKLGLWDLDMKNRIIAESGSIQNIPEIPAELKLLYRTVWEIKQKDIIDMAADRGAFIDQSQSLNIFMATPTKAKITSMHFYGWKKGLKTGMYYLRTKPAVNAIQFTVDQQKLNEQKEKETIQNVLSPSKKSEDLSESVKQIRSPVKTPTKLENPSQFAIEVVGQVCRMEEGCLMCGS